VSEIDPALLSAHLDGELDATEAAALAAGLTDDPALTTELEAVAEVRSLLRALPRLDLPPEVVAAVAEDRAPGDDATVVDLSRRRLRRGATLGLGAAAAAAALVVALVVPDATRTSPSLASEVQVHQAGSAASGEPVSGLAPLATALRVGR
jgi:anti-sigma factor RsiW